MSNVSIWNLGRTLSNATTPGPSEPGSDGNEGVRLISQRCKISGDSPSYSLVSYAAHSFEGGSYSAAEMHSMYYTTLADGAAKNVSGFPLWVK